MISFLDNNVNSIIKSRQDKASLPLHYEVDIVDSLPFQVDILVFLVLNWDQHWAQPGHERQAFLFEETDLFVHFFVNFLR